MKGEGPNIAESDYEEPGHPPTDENGFYYVVEFRLPSAGEANNGSTSWGHATLEEAVQFAEEKVPSPIAWGQLI
jgi:hypothetical protein